MKKILFLCTANYYRSRFAEIMFNYLAQNQELEWEADSRGIALHRGLKVFGKISVFTIIKLKFMGINLPQKQRYPLEVKSEDFENADIVIAMNEYEHHPLMLELFPNWVDKVEYWDIRDSHRGFPLFTLRKLEKNILQLLERLASS